MSYIIYYFIHCIYIPINILFLKISSIYFFRERGREGGKPDQLPLTHPNWGPGPQPRHVPWLGIELATFWFTGRCSIHLATPARAKCIIFIYQYRTFFLNFIYFQREWKGGREGERHQCVAASCPLLGAGGAWPKAQACFLARNQTSDPLVRRLVLSPLSHTSQG